MNRQLVTFFMVTGFSVALGLTLRHALQNKTLAKVSMVGDTVEIPLNVYGPHLYLRGKINGTVMNGLLLDSGADNIFMAESQVKALKLKASTSSHRLGIMPRSRAVDIPGVRVDLGAVSLQDQTSSVLSQSTMQGLRRYFGRAVDGVLGYELFATLVVEVDYQKSVIRFHRPETYRYVGQGQVLPLELHGQRPYVEATVFPYGYVPLKGLFMIDLGSGGGLFVNVACGIDQKLVAAAPKILKRKLTTIRGIQDIPIGQVQQIKLGEQALDRPLTVFLPYSEGPCDRITGKIGNQILRQFKVILDYSRRRLILEPNSHPSSHPYEYDLSGLWIQATGADFNTYRVDAVFPNTPAAKAGFQTGDILKSLDGVSSQGLNLAQVRQTLSQSGRTVKVEVQRGSKSMKATLHLKPLL